MARRFAGQRRGQNDGAVAEPKRCWRKTGRDIRRQADLREALPKSARARRIVVARQQYPGKIRLGAEMREHAAQIDGRNPLAVEDVAGDEDVRCAPVAGNGCDAPDDGETRRREFTGEGRRKVREGL